MSCSVSFQLMYFHALASLEMSWFFPPMYLVEFVASSQNNNEKKKKKMNILKLQATEESPLHSISFYFPDPSTKLTISLDLNLVLD